MRLGRTARIRGEGAGPLLVIVALILGGIVWWLYSSRQDAQKTVRTFAAEITKRTAVNYDGQYLNLHMSPAAQGQYLVSWRDRLFARLREFGVPEQPIDIQGDVAFTSYFFDPHGLFKAQLKYPTTTAQLELGISRGMTNWQLDSIDMIWDSTPGAYSGANLDGDGVPNAHADPGTGTQAEAKAERLRLLSLPGMPAAP